MPEDAPDPSNVVAAMERIELRAVIAGLSDAERVSFALGSKEPRVAEAVLSAPATVSGLAERTKPMIGASAPRRSLIMSDQKPIVQAAHNTPEQVAMSLFHIVARMEKKSLDPSAPSGWTAADRTWILNTYGECIRTVREGKYSAR